MVLEKLFNKCKRKPKTSNENSDDINTLMSEIDEVKKLIDTARCNFNNVTDADSIDYYTYILKAYQVRHDMLIKQLKASFV
ncbi:MAG: DUF2508 family protein [Ruminococcaceae bacterium]|nr:DUF2508 family protein [Oscillospiraceae bacterium]